MRLFIQKKRKTAAAERRNEESGIYCVAFWFHSIQLCQILGAKGLGEKDGAWLRGKGGLQEFLLFWTSGDRGWVGIVRASYRSAVHNEFFLHKNVLLLREKGFIQSLAFSGSSLAPPEPLKTESSPVVYVAFLSHSSSAPLSIGSLLCFLLRLHWVAFLSWF